MGSQERIKEFIDRSESSSSSTVVGRVIAVASVRNYLQSALIPTENLAIS